MSDEKPYYAFYSKTQEIGRKSLSPIRVRGLNSSRVELKRNVKHNIYELVSGEEVVVTQVSRNPNFVSNYKDVVNLGEVKRWVRLVFW